jgi:hypothetical protein
MRLLFSITLASVTAAAAAQEAPLFFDNFDNSFPGEPALIGSIWPTWPAANDHNNLSDNRSHTMLVCGTCTNSVRNDPQYHSTLANYTDFGAASVGVTATVWLWDDLDIISGVPTGNPPYPVNIFIGFFGDSPTGPTANTDYLLLGVDPTFTNNNYFGFKTLTGGAATTGISRAAAKAGTADGSGWTKLDIQADSLARGGQVRFYINDALVGTSYREAGINLRYFFMGNLNVGGGLTSNYEFWWFDDVLINAIPEISGLSVANGTATINFISAANDLASNFTLLSSSTVNGGYAAAVGASITGSGGSYQAIVPTSGDTQFYRIQR